MFALISRYHRRVRQSDILADTIDKIFGADIDFIVIHIDITDMVNTDGITVERTRVASDLIPVLIVFVSVLLPLTQ